jgi:hypothetical protein
VRSEGTTTAAPEEPDRPDAPLARHSRRLEQIGASAAGAVEHEQILRPAKSLDLAGEDLLEAEVVTGGSENG